MEFAVVATPADALGLRLDWERFSYAGKFVMTNTGKALVVEDGVLADPDWPPTPQEAYANGVLAAVSFNRDRERPGTAWLRYVTVRNDRRGDELGPRLCAFTTNWLIDGFDGDAVDRVRIAVNNPYAFDALYKAGFGWTGEETGLQERVLESPSPVDSAGGTSGAAVADRYSAGLRSYLDTDLSTAERAFVESRLERGPPARVDVPKGEDYTGRGHRDE